MRASVASLPHARVVAQRLTVSAPVETALVAFARQRGGVVLESCGIGPRHGRFTILATGPLATIAVGPDQAQPLELLRAIVESCPTVSSHDVLPFIGGWVGFISYEAGLTIERIAPAAINDVGFPLLRFALYDTVALYDHGEGAWYAAGVDWNGDQVPFEAGRPAIHERLADMARTLRSAPPPPPIEWDAPVGPQPTPNTTQAEYVANVGHIRERIHCGDVYQVNLTRRFTTHTAVAPLELYRRLRRANPAEYAAFLAWDDNAVLSASPELFLELRGGRVVTRPIKGTRPRSGDPTCDARQQAELAASEKDRAELNMIIDLLRNDLGRVCAYGSVRVDSDGELEAHPTVFHRVATVSGTLAEGRDWYDLLRATLPGGSVTGAPKVAACKFISALEPTRRDVYCGAIGYIGLDRAMCFNLAIRTMLMSCGQLHLYAGGGIVADSVAEDEAIEITAKAAGMMKALGLAPARGGS